MKFLTRLAVFSALVSVNAWAAPSSVVCESIGHRASDRQARLDIRMQPDNTASVAVSKLQLGCTESMKTFPERTYAAPDARFTERSIIAGDEDIVLYLNDAEIGFSDGELVISAKAYINSNAFPHTCTTNGMSRIQMQCKVGLSR